MVESPSDSDGEEFFESSMDLENFFSPLAD